MLDPFVGSGTVGRVAEDLGRLWLGFDLNPEYAKLAEKRMTQTSMIGIFNPSNTPPSEDPLEQVMIPDLDEWMK